MQSAACSHYCPSCNHLMIVVNVASIFRECNLSHKPVAVTANTWLQQQSPGSSYSMNEDEVFETKQEAISNSGMESDQWSLYSEGISYEETDSDHNDNSYNSLDDPLTVNTCIQCCTVGHDELVIPKLHNNSSTSHHTSVCTYCRERTKKRYYQDHPIRCTECLTHFKYNYKQYSIRHQKGEQYFQEHEKATEHISEEETQNRGHNFVVNCMAKQASD